MPRLDRRQLLHGLAAAPLAAGPLAAAASTSSLIRDENAKPGTTDWQLTYVRTDPATRSNWGPWAVRSPLIEGYASRTSVRPGERIDLFVSTNPAARYTLDIYRLGYYQGTGGRHLLHLGPFAGKPQPTPPVGDHRLRECRWEKAVTLDVPKDWLSGVYLGKLSGVDHRYQSYLIFIVRDDRPADFLFQCSDNTWQAYNAWPSAYSLYHNDRKDGRPLVSGVRVSRDRPYGRYMQIHDNPLSQGSGEFLLWEFPLAYWLEQHGYDVTYASNVDINDDLKTLPRCKGFLSVGHDEYGAGGNSTMCWRRSRG
ncbi:MAG: DUF6605 domain-containing protein [Gemmataceae bacterium]